jgi:hypothetical protein
MQDRPQDKKEQWMEIGPVVPVGWMWLAVGAAGVPAIVVLARMFEAVLDFDPR